MPEPGGAGALGFEDPGPGGAQAALRAGTSPGAGWPGRRIQHAEILGPGASKPGEKYSISKSGMIRVRGGEKFFSPPLFS